MIKKALAWLLAATMLLNMNDLSFGEQIEEPVLFTEGVDDRNSEEGQPADLETDAVSPDPGAVEEAAQTQELPEEGRLPDEGELIFIDNGPVSESDDLFENEGGLFEESDDMPGEDESIVPEEAEGEELFDEIAFFEEETFMDAAGNASGSCGANVTWTLSNGVLTLTGSGETGTYTTPPWGDSAYLVTRIIVSSGITKISEHMLDTAENLAAVYIPRTCTEIGYCDFMSLQLSNFHFYYEGSKAEYDLIYRDYYSDERGIDCDLMNPDVYGDYFHPYASIQDALGGVQPETDPISDILASGTCGNLNWTLTNAGKLTISGQGEMPDYATPAASGAEAPWASYVSRITSLDIREGVKSIGSGAFRNFSGLSSLTLPKQLTKVGKYAFKGCSGIRSVTIPESARMINDYAFDGCSSLADVYYSASQKEWGWIRFGSNNSKIREASIHFDKSVVSSYDGNFQYLEGKTDLTGVCHYKDSCFLKGSYQYDHTLSRMSLCLAMSAFASSWYKGYTSSQAGAGSPKIDPAKHYYAPTDIFPDYINVNTTPARNVAALLDNCGFTSIAVNRAYLVTTSYDSQFNDGNSIGVCIGTKELSDGSSLIAVALRGAGYGCEWIGDFNVAGSGKKHTGFALAASEVNRCLNEYVQKTDLNNAKVKVWITGYSRAAATANLVAAGLADNGLPLCSLNPQNIYCYGFETPMGTKASDANAQRYSGIWSIVNPIDPVPLVAMKRWGYTRYGNTVYLPSQYVKEKVYNKYKGSVLSFYNSYMGTHETDIPHVIMQKYLVEELTDELAQMLENEDSAKTAAAFRMVQSVFRDPEKVKTDAFVLLGGLLLNPGIPVTLKFKSVLAGLGVADNAKKMFTAHFPALTRAWLEALPSSAFPAGPGADAEVVTSYTQRYSFINCPVDVEVYDGLGNLQLKIIDNEVCPEAGAAMEALVDADGQKVICIPQDMQADIRVKATDNGTVSYAVREYDSETGQQTQVLEFFDVPVSKGDELATTVETFSEGAAMQDMYHLYAADGQEIQPDGVYAADELPEYTVTVEAAGGGTVDGSTRKKAGEFAMVTATPGDQEVFLGWYAGEDLVSEEMQYKICVKHDMVLTGRFAQKQPETDPPAPKPPAPKPRITLNAVGTIPMKTGQTFKKVIASGMLEGDSVNKVTSSKPGVLNASLKNGVIVLKARKKGTATVTVGTVSGASASFKVKVQKGKVKLKAVKVAKKSIILELKKQKKFDLKATLSPITASEKIKYTSSNKKVAAVSGKGIITAKKKGKAVITVTAGKKKCKVKVTVKP